MRFVKEFASTLGLMAAIVSAIGHDQISPFDEDAPEVFLKYKPYLKVSHGCVPFPAVNADGEISGGLNPSGSSNGKCSSSEGQVYCRGNKFPNSFAMMYSWYMPKDQPIEGGGAGPHRHEWEEVVVWLSDDSPDAEFLGLAYSVHGDYDKVKGKDGIKFDGSHPLIEYGYDGFTNHHLWLAEEKGGSQPLIDWNALPEAAQNGLQTGDFEDAHVPFNDENFQGKLKKASL